VTRMKRHLRRHNIRQFAKEIHGAANCLSECRATIAQKTGLTVEHWRALAAIDRSSFVLSISDLARRLRRPRQSAHPLALGLERAGWIRFLPNRDDRRLIQIELTEHGKTILNIAEGRFDFWLLTMAADLDDRELQTLVDTLRDVRERITHARDHV
jgi:DNA-binding MarR family transcriptional regulator